MYSIMRKPIFSPNGKVDRVPIPSSTAHRILVVEDDADIRRLNAEVLTQCGYQVDAAEDADVAWHALQENSYDLLVMDNEMPMLTGVDLLKKLYAAHLVVPVIMATETLPLDEFTRFPWLLPAAMLTKPYTIDEFLGTVQAVLRATGGAPGQTPPRSRRNQSPAEKVAAEMIPILDPTGR